MCVYIYIYISLYIIYKYIKGTYSPKDRIKRCDLDVVNTSSDVEAQVVSAWADFLFAWRPIQLGSYQNPGTLGICRALA
jgi:hypothetical protein